MTKQPKSKPKEALCTFDRVEVQLGVHGRTTIIEPPHYTTISVDPKLIHLCGKYKIAWKKVNSLQVLEDGFMVESEKHNVAVIGPLPTAGGPEWQLCQKLLKRYWNKQQNLRARKSEEQKQQEEEERRTKQRTYSSRRSSSYSRSSYVSKTAKFLARNERENNWDSSDDEDTFNVQRPKRKPLEEEQEQEEQPPKDDGDDIQEDAVADSATDDVMVQEENQEQAMEDAAADAELAERQAQEEEEEEMAADSEPEEPPVKMPKRTKFKRKRVQDDDDDSDDDMFGAAMTTPNPRSRTVSPHTIAKTRFQDDDDDDDDEQVTKVASTKTTTTTKTAPIASFFQPTKKTKTAVVTAKKEKQPPQQQEEEASVPPPVKRNATTSSFFAPKRSAAAKATASPEDTMEEEDETVVPSQTPTVVASQLSSSSTPVMDDSVHPSTPKRKIEFSKHFGSSSNKTTMEDEDPIVDSPATSPVRVRTFRKKMLGRRTYGSSSKKDRAARALELADAHQSPKRRSLALALSPGRKRHDFSPIRSRSPTNSPNRLLLLPMPDFRGIKNIGNTCYMNASLQMLFSVPNFLQQLLAQEKGSLAEHSVVSSLVELFQDLQVQQQRSPGSARNLKMAVDRKTNKFQGYQQRDANEFLGDLLDTIHDELVEGKEKQQEKEDKEEEKKQEEDETTKSSSVYPTDNFFRLDVEVCLKCKSCGYSRTKEEMYRYLSLDILQNEEETTTKPNIDECLQAFFQPEDREIKCEECHDGLVAEQTMKVLSRPKAILLHLKRFAMVEQPRKEGSSPTFVLRKNKAAVELHQSLSLDPFLKSDDDTKAVAKQEYKIQSIVHHIGTSADSGHYTADALRKDPKDDSGKAKTWVSFDDTLVERLSEADVLEDKPRRKTAYMMLYTLEP